MMSLHQQNATKLITHSQGHVKDVSNIDKMQGHNLWKTLNWLKYKNNSQEQTKAKTYGSILYDLLVCCHIELYQYLKSSKFTFLLLPGFGWWIVSTHRSRLPWQQISTMSLSLYHTWQGLLCLLRGTRQRRDSYVCSVWLMTGQTKHWRNNRTLWKWLGVGM